MQAPVAIAFRARMLSEAGRRRRTSIYSLGAEIALWALAFFCPLALGSAPAWTLWPLCAVSGVALVLACIGMRRQGQALRVPMLAWALLLPAALCLVQLLPLPGPLLGWLSPEAAEMRDFTLVPLGLTRARPISLDPPATWRELAKHLAYAAVLLTAAQVSRSRRARRRLVGAVALAGVGVALIGYGHQLLEARSLFGVYPVTRAQPFPTPFGNANHLAGFLLLCSTLCLGLALSSERRQRAAAWGLGFLVAGPAVLLSLSRAGIFFFAVAQLLFGALLLWRWWRTRRASGPAPASGVGALWVLLGAAAVAAIGGYLALERLLAELSTADSLEKLRASKVELWPMLARAAGHFWRAGMGRGAFEAGFPRFQTMLPGYTFTHPENVVLQLWAELGVPAALAVVALAVWGLGRLVRRQAPSALDLAALAGVCALVLHNLFDFNLELPACAVAACLALGALARPTEREERPGELRLPPGAALPAAGGALALSLLALVPGRHTLAASQEAMAAALASDAPPGEVRRVALELIDQHPADYLPYAVAGRAYARKGADPREALAFVNRALFLRPLDAEAHRTAARSLLRLGRRGQAFLEYRLAAQAVETEARAILAEAAGQARGMEELTTLTPPEPARACDVAWWLWERHRGQEAVELLDWGGRTMGDSPDSGPMWTLLATLRTTRREFPEALAALEQAEARQPSLPGPVLARANTLWEMGRTQEAVKLLEDSILRQPGSVELSFALAEKLLAQGNARRALDALSRASPFLGSSGQRAQLFELQARAFELQGRPARALEAYQTASRLLPEAPGLHYAIARLYEGMGKPGDAIREVHEGMRRDSPQGLEVARGWLARLEKAERQAEEARKQKADTRRALDLEGLMEEQAATPEP